LLIGRLIIPVFTTRLAPSAIALGGVLTAALALGGAALPGLAPYGYALAGFGLAPVFPAMLAMASRTGASPQFANGVMLSACMVGGVIWPVIIGLVADPAWPATIPLALAGLGVLCLLAIWNAVRGAGDDQEISHS
jgi:fucose permease